MLLPKISDEEREVMELLTHPVSCAEILFTNSIPNLESLKNYTDKLEDSLKVRSYQIPFVSYEYIIAEDPELSSDKIFELKKNVGDSYNYSGRKIGKSLFKEIDLLEDSIHNFPWNTDFSAFDAEHIDPILDPFCSVLDNHPFFSLFQFTYRKRPYIISNPLNHFVKSINMTLSGSSPGKNWEKERAHKILIDEHQYEIDEVAHRRSQATSENSAILRFSGITSFKKHTPAGRIFEDLTKENQLINLPEYVSPAWNEKRKQEAIEDYDGEDAPNYRINVGAEVIEGLKGLYDMERIRPCYKKERYVKRFEIDKDNFPRFKNELILDRPGNVFRVWIAGDYGRSGSPSEIIVIYEMDKPFAENLYRYIYNITLYDLVPDEQFEVYRYLMETLKANFIGIDCTEEGGRQIYRDLSKVYPRDNLYAVGFNEKIEIDFERDEQGQQKFEKGEPVYAYEMVIDWAVRRLKILLYNQRLEISYDYRFDKQFSAMDSMVSGNRIKYASSEEDHLHQAFQVFGILEWVKATFFTKPIEPINFFKSGV